MKRNKKHLQRKMKLKSFFLLSLQNMTTRSSTNPAPRSRQTAKRGRIGGNRSESKAMKESSPSRQPEAQEMNLDPSLTPNGLELILNAIHGPFHQLQQPVNLCVLRIYRCMLRISLVTQMPSLV